MGTETADASLLASLRGLMARPLTSYYLLLSSSGLLLVIGLAMVFSATSVESYADSGNPYASIIRQSIYALVGLAAFWLAQRTPLRIYKKFSGPLVIIAFALLVLLDGLSGLHRAHFLKLTSFGPLTFDSLRIYLGPLQLQPSEVAKIALVLWGAGVLVGLGENQKRFREVARSLFPLAGTMLILVGVNDLGTMLSMMILLVGLMFAAGVQTRVFGYLAVIALVGIGLLVIIHGYRSTRLTGFFHPLTNCDVSIAGNPCYQELEGRYAIANGGWFGVGLGQGHLKWGRLPYGYNDFIFAEIAEELGVFGCFVVLALLAVLAYTGLRIARRVGDPFRRIASTAIIAWLVGQATINIGGVIGLLPITGLPLPFISDGGTALVVVLIAIGILASFARAEPDAARALHARPPQRWVRLLWAPLPPLPRNAPPAGRKDRPDAPMPGAEQGKGGREPAATQRRS